MEVHFVPWLDPDPSGEDVGAGSDEGADEDRHPGGSTSGGRGGGEVRCAYTLMEVDEAAGTVSLCVTGGGTMCGEDGPFKVTPAGPVVIPASGGCKGFSVEYAYKGKPRAFIGSVVGQHKLAGAGGDEGKGLTLELGCAATRFRVGGHGGAAGAMPAGSSNPVRVRIDGGFHPSAGAPPQPMKALVVRIAADACSPRLQPDAEANFAWVCHAPVDALHSTYYRAVTLTNTWSTPVGFRLRTGEGAPFGIVEVESSVPQLGLERASTLSRSPHAGSKVEAVPFMVPPRENVHVTMKFFPPPPGVSEDGSADRQDYVSDGALVVEYDNEDVQTFPLVSEYIHPEIIPSTPELFFGKVHVNAPTLRTKRLVLTNKAEADAEWSVGAQLDETGRGCSAFTCTPSSGVIQGKGRNGLAQSVTLEVMLSPKEEGEYEAAIDFLVCMGRGCRVVCRGEGSWDEVEEGKAVPRWDPLDA